MKTFSLKVALVNVLLNRDFKFTIFQFFGFRLRVDIGITKYLVQSLVKFYFIMICGYIAKN